MSAFQFELLERALSKMRREQKRDPNCIWSEIETYLLYMESLAKASGYEFNED
jgi:hypothetical protein